MGGSTGLFQVFQRRWILVWVQPCVGAMEADNDPLSSAPVTSLCLSPQESEISEHPTHSLQDHFTPTISKKLLRIHP